MSSCTCKSWMLPGRRREPYGKKEWSCIEQLLQERNIGI